MSPDDRRLPDELLPLVMMWTFVRARAYRVKDTEDLGALSFELVLLAIGLILVAAAVIAVLTKAINDKATKLQ